MEDLDISIIIQGPTKYYLDILPSYKGFKNVLWCIWDDEPNENITAIRNSGIYVNLISKPINSGYWNINLQCKSTMFGLIESKKLFNSKFYIKIRSDFKIFNMKLLCNRFIERNEKLNFIGWANMENGFFLDYIVFGEFEPMERFWEFVDKENSGLPCPEKFLMERYFGNAYTLHEIKKFFYSKMPVLDGIGFYWVSKKMNIRDFSSEVFLKYNRKRLFYYFKFKILAFLRNKKIIK